MKKETMKKLGKLAAVTLTLVLMGTMFTACGGGDSADGDSNISVISREEGSGTRGAFVELLGIEEKDADGNKVDHTIETAEITNSTAVMMQTVASNNAAIGYISLGSLDDSVRALKIDGVEASVDTVKSGEYKVSRPFNIVTGEETDEVTDDFSAYILSDQGQAVVEQEGYVSQGSTGKFTGGKAKGKIVISGSTSVSPVMEVLKEAYMTINPDAEIELQTSDSTTGITDAISGVANIGMASRDLKDEETSQGVIATVIAKDGIAIIVNNQSAITELTSDQVKSIYTGTITKWSELA